MPTENDTPAPSSATPTRDPDVDGMAFVAFLVQPLAKRCMVKGCRGRVTETVTIADRNGIIVEDSLLTASCCGRADHQRKIRDGLGRRVVEARLRDTYGPNARIDVGLNGQRVEES